MKARLIAASAGFARARSLTPSDSGSARSRHGAAEGRAGLRAGKAGRRGSSEDDLPLRLNHAQDLGAGRGLNPTPDEHGPAETEYDGFLRPCEPRSVVLFDKLKTRQTDQPL